MFTRQITSKLQEAATAFYALALVGPRQGGKTTLLRWLFPDYRYINLESPDTRAAVMADPRGFFADQKQRWIIDEAQECPELFSFLLSLIDENKIKGQFILSGSQNFALLQNITQSLAGRIAILELLPLNYTEFISGAQEYKVQPTLWEYLYQGSYPGPISQGIDAQLWYRSYITTYIERDIRQLIHVKDLNKFHLFLKLCAGRHGQLLNLSQLGDDCGISHTTAYEWISVLEASYIVFRLMPYYKNINKRLVKTPKLYFIDSGLACYLLGVESAEHLQLHASRGALFEGYIVSELVKTFYANAKTPSLYFCKLYSGNEIDILIEQGDQLKLIEVKSSATFGTHFTKQLIQFRKTEAFSKQTSSHIVYAGNEAFTTNDIHVLPWHAVSTLL